MPRTYHDHARSNGCVLLDTGSCQLCGALMERGVHECVEVLELGFGGLGLSEPADHIYRFLMVDAHALQHPELHGRWSEHFHLTRLRLIFEHDVSWSYAMSPRLSRVLDAYKAGVPEEVLVPPPPGARGEVTAADVRAHEEDPEACRAWIERWACSVHQAWAPSHARLDRLLSRALTQM